MLQLLETLHPKHSRSSWAFKAAVNVANSEVFIWGWGGSSAVGVERAEELKEGGQQVRAPPSQSQPPQGCSLAHMALCCHCPLASKASVTSLHQKVTSLLIVWLVRVVRAEAGRCLGRWLPYTEWSADKVPLWIRVAACFCKGQIA